MSKVPDALTANALPALATRMNVNVVAARANRMYERYREFDSQTPAAKSVKRVLGILAEVFPEKTPELERFNVISRSIWRASR
jgi:hypothetical protein